MPQIVLGGRTPAQGVDAGADLDPMFAELFARIAVAAAIRTPVLTSGANVAAAVANASSMYVQFGSFVLEAGTIQIDPTAASVATSVGISLAVASNFSTFSQCAGVAARKGASGMLVGLITGDTANDRANLSFVNDAEVADATWSYIFLYRVI